MTPSQKINLKDKVEDGEIDLSMCDLQDVPVREIANIRNIYSLDLSNNRLTSLPKNFATLIHITKLDLSKNVLKELPENFGELSKLKHLDLYKNELKHLPLSFGKLRALKWLDLKDNPLVSAIKDMAGPCLDGKQCQVCAKNIVQFYSDFQQKVDTERDARERQRQRDKQANELALQKLKQQEKKNKKKEKVKHKANGDVLHDDEIPTIDQVSTDSSQEKINKPRRNKQSSPSIMFIKLFLLLTMIVVLVLFLTTSVKLKYTQFIETKVEEIWKDCVGRAPLSMQLLGNNFAQYIKSLHLMTGEGLSSIASYIQETKQHHD